MRGIAFLAVVLQHVITGLFYLPSVSPGAITVGAVILAVIRFAVPLFVFITGVVLFYNYSNEIKYKSFLVKRFNQVILPYIIWTFFYFVWIKFLFGITNLGTWNGLKELVLMIFTGGGNYHLWFMVMIIPFYFIFPIMKLIISKERKLYWNMSVLTAFFIINFGLLYTLSKGIFSGLPANFNFFVNYLDRNFLFWSFYFVLGGVVGIYYKQFLSFVLKTRFMNLAIWVSLLVLIFIEIKEVVTLDTLNRYLQSAGVTSPLDPIIYLYLISSILIVFWFSYSICNGFPKLSALLNTFGKYSFGAYLIHAFVLHFTNKFVIRFLEDTNVYILVIVSFVLCSVFSVILCILISKVKISLGGSIVGKV